MMKHATLALVAFVVGFSSVGAALPAASEKPAATKPAGRPVLKITTTPTGYKQPISALVDINDAPDLKEWATRAANFALKWYPEIDRQLASENFDAPRTFVLVFRDGDGVAATSGHTITINAKFVRKHPDDIGMVAHELVHVIQKYPRGFGWVTEGIADYIRYYVVEPDSKNARFNPDRQDYKGGYQPAAALLNWIEKTRGPGIVAKLNQALRNGKYDKDTFKTIVGDDAETMWGKFKESLKKRES